MLTDDDAKTHLAENLRRLLDETKTSQTALAQAVDVSNMSITFYLQGVRMAGAGPLARIAEFFGVSTDFLLAKPTRKKSQKSA